MVYLAIKDGKIVHQTSLKALLEMDGIEKPDMEITTAQFEAAEGIFRIENGKIIVGKTEAELEIENEIQQLSIEQRTLQIELESKDYKVVKAAETGLALSEADPELHKRREWCRDRINNIRESLSKIEKSGVAG